MDKEFEQWIVANAIYSQTAKDGAWLAWQHLRPEIAALKAEVERLRADAELNRQRYLHEVYRTK